MRTEPTNNKQSDKIITLVPILKGAEGAEGIEKSVLTVEDIKIRAVRPEGIPKWEDLKKEYEPSLHAIFTDKTTFPDKEIKDSKGNLQRMEPRTRVGIGLQKLSVKRLAEFMFTLDPTLIPIFEGAEPTEAEQMAFRLFKKILKKSRWYKLNKQRCKILSSECEQATYWYYEETTNTNYYGSDVKTNFKLKAKIFSPSNGDILYPLFDETGDLIAFSRGFNTIISGKRYEFFESWDVDYHHRFIKDPSNGAWFNQEGYPKPNPIKKIPIVYEPRIEPLWREADNGKINEIEMLLSRNGDIIAYHSSPVLLIKGSLQGAPSKGEANKVFTTNGDGDAKYVSWEQSPEAIKFQFESLMRAFFLELQLPDLSFENIKGLGAVSGDAREWLLTDAHLKVGDEADAYDVIFSRELSIIKSYMKLMFTDNAEAIDSLDIDFKINPFTIKDLKTKVDVLVSATGNKPILSQEKAAELADLVDDPKADFIRIKAERLENSSESIFPIAENF